MAATATLHCLTGCAIGEVLGTSVGLSDRATVALAAALAFVSGHALTMRGVLRAGLPQRQALATDTISIAVMEVVDDAVALSVPGAMEAGVATALFWLSRAGALAVAFVVTLPVNRAMTSRGRGHAVVHGLH